MLYSLSTTNKRYICEVCVDTPSIFFQNIIAENLQNCADKMELLDADKCTVQGENSEHSNNRLDDIESKVDMLIQIVGKYDIPRVADGVQKANENFVRLNNDCKEFNGQLNKAIAILNGITITDAMIKDIDGKHPAEE